MLRPWDHMRMDVEGGERRRRWSVRPGRKMKILPCYMSSLLSPPLRRRRSSATIAADFRSAINFNEMPRRTEIDPSIDWRFC